jgi:hypothetical protein
MSLDDALKRQKWWLVAGGWWKKDASPLVPRYQPPTTSH